MTFVAQSMLSTHKVKFVLGRFARGVQPVLGLWDRLNVSVFLVAMFLIVYDIGFPKELETDVLVSSALHGIVVGLFISYLLRLLVGQLYFRSLDEIFSYTLKKGGTSFILFGYVLVVALFKGPWEEWLPHLVLSAVFVFKVSQSTFSLGQIGIEPAMLIALSFLFMILGGAGLLLLPNSTVNGISTIDALFTSASAICVTGLATVDTEFAFSFTGKFILLILIQTGGLGIMTLTTFLGNFFMGSIDVKQRLMVRELVASERMSEVTTLVRNVVLITFSIELIGAVFIYFSVGSGLSVAISDRIWFSLFHSVSAFCNAGFSTLSVGLAHSALQFNTPFLMSIGTLIIIGGIGYPILFNYGDYLGSVLKARWRSMTTGIPVVHHSRVINMHTKIVLSTTAFLIIFGSVVFFLIERHHLLAQMGLKDALVSSIFASVSPRTAGFNTLDMAGLSAASMILIYFLMWVGGAPASTAGGIKTTTFAVAFSNIVGLGKDSFRVEVFGRELPSSSVRRAFAVISLSILFIGVGVMVLSITENTKDVGKLIFECISAFSTVGLTMGLTAKLSTSGKVVIILLMYLGRVGAFTIVAGLIPDIQYQRYRYPKENIMIT